ncbi:substrate-binding domain-containing protein [Marivita sp. S2033]|uniref:substrate-binding domain-containing protein n=1 Tax=Marivita sp. S2033 TaxID=3373187 RepID=UPI0039819FC4
MLHTISVHYLSARIAELEDDIPGLRVRVYSDNLRVCCQFLQEGTCDFLLYYRHKDVMPVFDERQFERKDIGTEQLIPVAATDVAQAQGWDLSAQNGDDIPYLGYDPASLLGTVVDQTIGTRKPRLALCYMDALVEALKRRALYGSGVAWLPEGSVAGEIAQGLLVPVGGKEWQATLTLSLFCSVDRLDRVGKAVWDAL